MKNYSPVVSSRAFEVEEISAAGLTMYFLTTRWHNPGPVGGRHRFDAPVVRQRVRQLHDDRVGQVLVDGLPERQRGHQDGHRALPRGHSRPVHG